MFAMMMHRCINTLRKNTKKIKKDETDTIKIIIKHTAE